MNENVIEWLNGQDKVTVTIAANGRFRKKIIKLAEDRPDECDVIINKDGSICAHIPLDWIRINPTRELSEAQKEVLERMHQIRLERSQAEG